MFDTSFHLGPHIITVSKVLWAVVRRYDQWSLIAIYDISQDETGYTKYMYVHICIWCYGQVEWLNKQKLSLKIVLIPFDITCASHSLFYQIYLCQMLGFTFPWKFLSTLKFVTFPIIEKNA